MRKIALFVLCTSIVVVAGCSGDKTAEETTTGGTTATTGTSTSEPTPTMVAYADVQAILDQNCVKCHSGDKPKAGVNLTNHEGVMKGGEDGPIVKAGEPENSEIISVMHGAEGHKMMPPKGMGDPVAEDKIKVVEDWIKGGAKA